MENQENNPVSFIDKFIVPAPAKAEFYNMIRLNRNFVKNLPGFIEGADYERTDEQDNLIYVSVAKWESTQAIDKAKEMVEAEHKKPGFDTTALVERLGIILDRALYREPDPSL
jgi:hypothetical protein